MKILHISAVQNGGAALCAKRIMHAEELLGHECKFLTIEGPEGYNIAVIGEDKDFWHYNLLGKILRHLLIKLTPWFFNKDRLEVEFRKACATISDVPYCHLPLTSFKKASKHPDLEWADVIHLHWVSGMIDYPTFFVSIKKPIVWTLHDEHPINGLMHFESKFSSLPPQLKAIDKKCIDIKSEAVNNSKDLHVVALSDFMYNRIKRSKILGEFHIHKVHNGINTKVFSPFDKNNIRKELCLPVERTVFLFSSYSVSDKRKGLDRLITALDMLHLDNAVLLCLGMICENVDKYKCSVPILYMGLKNDQTELAKIYSASDFFINVSYQEAFAQTPIEAMSCGIPVISTPCSGAKDLINDTNGLICDDFTPESIAKTIDIAIKMQFDPKEIRNYIKMNFDEMLIAKQYIKLYEEILKK